VLVTPDGWDSGGVRGTVASIQPQAEFTPRVSLTQDERADQLFAARLTLDSALPAGLWVSVTTSGTADSTGLGSR
jgi:hypothetical protein